VILVELDLEPIPMPRAGRHGRAGQTYLPAPYRAYRDALSWAMLHARNRASVMHPFEDPLELMVTFARSSKLRVDGDNLEKTVLDAGTNVLWMDDSQIHRVCWEKVLGSSTPGTTIRVQPMGA